MKSKRKIQTELFPKQAKTYGGELLKSRKGRQYGRPLDTRQSMHLVLRSSKAKGAWSFRKSENHLRINNIVKKFSVKYGIKVISLANVGNHLHLHIKISNRRAYKAFIRAITSAIAMAVTKASRWQPMERTANTNRISKQDRFWDYRPFTRVLTSFREFLNLKDYIAINQLEGLGIKRVEARVIIKGPSLRSG